MEKEGTSIKLYPSNYWCINCASQMGLMVPADIIIWDDIDLKCIPLCTHCHEFNDGEPEFNYNFSEN